MPGSAAAAGGAGARGGGGGGAGPAPGAPDAAYVVGSDGYLHALNVQNGWDNMTPALFLPANTRATGLIVANDETAAVVYAATTNGCGSQPDGVWAMDLPDARKDGHVSGAARARRSPAPPARLRPRRHRLCRHDRRHRRRSPTPSSRSSRKR